MKGPRALVALIRRAGKIISFTKEHENRPVRFIAVVNEYRRGKLVADIEKQFGCSRNTVMRYARLAGLERRPRGFEPGIREEVIKQYKSGKPIKEIAAALGVSAAYVSRTASEEGISRYKKRRAK